MAHPAPPSPKRRPTRNDTPGRYFQVGQCPHKKQEDCDFAHVYSDPLLSLPPPKQCRYYLQGNCTNGIWCQYLHGEANYQNINSLSGRASSVNPNTLQMSAESSRRLCTSPATSTPTWCTPHRPHGNILSNSFHRRICSSTTQSYLPTGCPDSIDFSSPSSSPTSSLSDDAVLFSTEDVPGQPYSYFSADSQAVCAPYLGAAYDDSIQPYPQQLSLSVIFTPKTPPSAGFYSSAGFSPNPQSPWSPIERDRQRLAHYRTKPCRYIQAGTVCPNGDACTLCMNLRLRRPPESTKLQHELPPKPLSSKEENRKEYFPISWRVIGGGVRVSGAKGTLPRIICRNIKFDLSLQLGPQDDGVSDLSPPPAPSHTVVFPSTNFDADADNSLTPTQPPVRQRATSIRLFSAESPGGL
ncbi:hypothetical protein B0H14DRAFT_2936470 [Mycena olivaceomarginata]|nr:hypothetical protein B0H14DRAFT_2936470 [Mycena olivaceomarginata]